MIDFPTLLKLTNIVWTWIPHTSLNIYPHPLPPQDARRGDSTILVLYVPETGDETSSVFLFRSKTFPYSMGEAEEGRQLIPGGKVVNVRKETDRQVVSALSQSHLFSSVDVMVEI